MANNRANQSRGIVTPPDDVVVRLARPADGARCNEFYNRYYGRTRTLEQWRWEFCRETLDDGTIPFAVAEHDGEVVGTQALIPIELVDPSGPYWSAKSEETLVASSMRGRGLFHRLYEPLLDVGARRRLESIWGFTPASTAFEREGFATPVKTSQLVRVFRSDAMANLSSAEPSKTRRRALTSMASSALAAYGAVVSATRPDKRPKALRIDALSSAPAWADELSLQFSRDWGGTTVHRTASYLRWRFFDNPFRRPLVHAAYLDDQPIGFIAFALGSNGVAAIVDLVVGRPAKERFDVAGVVAALIGEATTRARDMGASAIRAWHVTRHPFAELVRATARRMGWLHVQRGFDMVIKQTPGIPPREAAAPIDRWYVTRTFTEGSDA